MEKRRVRIYKAQEGGQPSIDQLGYPGAQAQEQQASGEEQLMQIIYQDISNEVPEGAIVAKLVNAYNMDPAMANQYVQQVYGILQNKIDQDELEEEDNSEEEAQEQVEDEILNENKPMSKIQGHTDLAMEDEEIVDVYDLGDEDMLKYGGTPRYQDGGEQDYVEAMNNDQMNWPKAETPIVFPDVSEYLPSGLESYLANDASNMAWTRPEESEQTMDEESLEDYTNPVVDPEEFRMGGFKTKKGYVNSVMKLVKKAMGGDEQEQDIKASDADPRGDDLRKNRLDAFVGSIKKEGNMTIAKEEAEKQFQEMQAMHQQMMMQQPQLQNFIPEDYEGVDYMQFGGQQRRAMRRMNRALRRMPFGIPGMVGPVTKFDVHRTGIFGRPKEYTIEFGENPLMQLAANPMLASAYGYGFKTKTTKTPGRLITETVRNTVNNQSTKDVANATGSNAANKSAQEKTNVTPEANPETGTVKPASSGTTSTTDARLQEYRKAAAAAGYDPWGHTDNLIGTQVVTNLDGTQSSVNPNQAPIDWKTKNQKQPFTVIAPQSKNDQPSFTPANNSVEDIFKKNPPRIGETNSAYLFRTTGNPGFYNNTDVWDGSKFIKTKKETTAVQPKTEPIVKSIPKPVEENKNTTPGGTTWTVSKKDSAPQEEFCYGEKCFSFPEEQQDDAFSFYDMPDVLRKYDMSNFNNLTKDELKKLMKESKHSFLSRQNIDTPEYDRFADIWLKYQKNRLANYPKDRVITYKDLYDQSAKEGHQAADAYSDFLNQYGKFKPGANPNDIYNAIGPLSPDYDKYEEGGLVDNPMPDQFGNLQRFIGGGFDPSIPDLNQADIDDMYSKDTSDPYMPQAQYGGFWGAMMRNYFPANFPQRYAYSQMVRPAYNRATGQQFANIPGFNPYAQIKDIQVTKKGIFGQPKRYTVTYNNNPSGKPGDRRLANTNSFEQLSTAEASAKSKEQAPKTKNEQKEYEKKVEQRKNDIYSNTEGLSGKARRQIRRGERRTARDVARGMEEFPEDPNYKPASNAPVQSAHPAWSQMYMSNNASLPSIAAEAQKKEYGGDLHRFIPQALLGNETPVSMENNPANSKLTLPTKSSKEVGQQLMMDSRKKIEEEAKFEPDEYSVDYKAKKKWLGDTQGAILTANAAGEGLAGWIDRWKNRNNDVDVYNNTTADNLYASDPSRDRGDYSITGSDYGLYRSPDQGQTWGSRSAQYGGASDYSEGAVVDMTEEELAEFLANGGQVEYL